VDALQNGSGVCRRWGHLGCETVSPFHVGSRGRHSRASIQLPINKRTTDAIAKRSAQIQSLETAVRRLRGNASDTEIPRVGGYSGLTE
jgi:hypothetical protein